MDVENTAVQKHIELQQSIISRMASNSSNCKSWAITVVAAILVIAYQENNQAITYLSFIPLFLFFLLDSFYLSIERDIRSNLRQFVNALHDRTLREEQLYVIELKTGDFSRIRKIFKTAFSSETTWPFYGLFFCLLIISRILFP